MKCSSYHLQASVSGLRGVVWEGRQGAKVRRNDVTHPIQNFCS